jgi:ribosome recycling factor
MEKAIANLKREFANVRTGRANPMILDKIQVDYYGMPTPIRQVANVTVQDGQTLVITPFDRNSLLDVEKAIAKSDLGLTPNNDGTCVRNFSSAI